jgi:adenylate kinase
MENIQEGSNLKTFIFIGRSGCGKGTQVEQLAEHLRGKGVINNDHAWLRVETGAQFRKFAERDNYSARKLKESMESGNRLPDCFAIWTWCNYFIENYTGEEHVFCDGCPRSLLEAQSLDFLFKFYNRKELFVVYLDISKEEATRRMLARGRADDQLEDIEKRLEWFDKDVVPAIEYYRNNPKYKFVEVDGEQSIEKIHEDLISMLEL